MTLWTVDHQAPLFMGFSRQDYRSELSCPPPGDLPNPEIKPRSATLQADSSYHLSHQLTVSKSEVPLIPFSDLINLLEQLTEFRETIYLLDYQFIIKR